MRKELDGQKIRCLREAVPLLPLTDETLKEEMYRFIDKVVIFSSDEIEIHWKLEDCFKRTGNSAEARRTI